MLISDPRSAVKARNQLRGCCTFCCCCCQMSTYCGFLLLGPVMKEKLLGGGAPLDVAIGIIAVPDGNAVNCGMDVADVMAEAGGKRGGPFLMASSS